MNTDGSHEKCRHHTWPGLPIEQVPIRSVTNGIHAPTWIAPELNQLYGKYLGPEWAEKCRRDRDVATSHRYPRPGTLGLYAKPWKRKTYELHPRTCRSGWIQGHLQAFAGLDTRDPARPRSPDDRLAQALPAYKRATLLFRDLERLKRLLP